VIYGMGMFVLLFLWHAYREIHHAREIDRLMNRVMAKDYTEFEYYDKKWKRDLAEVDKVRAENHVAVAAANADTAPAETADKVDNFISEFEEDWRPSDIDMDAAKKHIAARK